MVFFVSTDLFCHPFPLYHVLFHFLNLSPLLVLVLTLEIEVTDILVSVLRLGRLPFGPLRQTVTFSSRLKRGFYLSSKGKGRRCVIRGGRSFRKGSVHITLPALDI